MKEWNYRFSELLVFAIRFSKSPADRHDFPGILQIVGTAGIAIPIADEEISAIQTAVRSVSQHQPWPFIEVGERVRVTYGTLAGLEGSSSTQGRPSSGALVACSNVPWH